MTETEWLTSNDPAAMLRRLQFDNYGSEWPIQLASDRKLRCWVKACRAYAGVPDRAWGNYTIDTPNGLDAAVARWSVAEHPSILPSDPLPMRAALLREITGNPFRPVVLPMECPWIAPDVLAIAQACYDERSPDGTLDPVRLAILADALEEAGCEEQKCVTCKGRGAVGIEMCPECKGHQWHHPLLTHLRSPGPHVYGCWVLDLVLGKE